jgi:pentatricopeptide repeat protein
VPDKVLELFDKMSVKHDAVIITISFNACAKLFNAQTMKLARDVLNQLATEIFQHQNLVNSAVAMLMKFGEMTAAECLFTQMKKIDIYSLAVMMNGYNLNGDSRKCLDLFEEIKNTTMKLNDPICVSLTVACAKIGTLSICRRLTDHIPLDS